MKKNRLKIYFGVLITSILMYLFTDKAEGPNDALDLRTFTPLLISEELDIIVDSVGYSRGSFFIIDSNGDKFRIDALEYLNTEENNYSYLIKKEYSLKKKKDSDSLFSFGNENRLHYLIIDDLSHTH